MVDWEKGTYIDRNFTYRWSELGKKEVFEVATLEDVRKFWADGDGRIAKDNINEFAEAEMCKCISKLLNKFKKNDTICDIPTSPIIPIDRPPTKKALIVGINKYDPYLNIDLEGCVHDAENMYGLLVGTFEFPADNVRVLTDRRATKAAILNHLSWLVNDIAIGDELMFHYSGHGSQIRDREGDELDDGLDEIICPTDLNWDDPLTDDYLAALFKCVPDGVFLTMFSDSCHSGTITRGLCSTDSAIEKDKHSKPRYIKPPFDIRARSINRDLELRVIGEKQDKSTEQNHVLMSGCRDDQTSADALVSKKAQGAFTWAITSVIKAHPDITYVEAHAQVIKKLAKDFSQVPQLSGSSALINRKVFGGR